MDFVAYSFCQLLGAFIGSMLMWLAFLPHFKTVPEPPPDDVEETLLRSRDYVASPVLNIASYDTRREDDVFRSVKVINPSQVTPAIVISQSISRATNSHLLSHRATKLIRWHKTITTVHDMKEVWDCQGYQGATVTPPNRRSQRYFLRISLL